MVSPLDALLARPPKERRLGPYLLEVQLGRGGFAPVWKAREIYGDTEVRTVAIKIFSLGSLPDITPSGSLSLPSRYDSVIREARALCRVEHPGVVRFHTIYLDEDAALLGLVMEYLDGRSLEQRLREQGLLSADDAVDLGLQIASALRAVHEVGLVHRDIKPANIVEVRGSYKLIDFGIAIHEALPQDSRRQRVVLDDLPFEVAGTRPSFLLHAPCLESTLPTTTSHLPGGTIGYMDPYSVATGAPATPSSDLYSLGVVLFESLTGRLPSASDHGLRGEILDGRAAPESIATRNESIPIPLVHLVDALLRPERENRPPSAAAVEEALLAIASPPPSPTLSSATTPEPPATLSKRLLTTQASPTTQAPPSSLLRRWGWVAVAAVALGIGIVRWHRSPDPVCTPGTTAACTARCERGESTSCHILG
ncbi:MAG: serine/threonine protein kinase, partial [Polyangiaceae bacterium]|nr:serine/threonine protein kinase [Polyangiaceae bacterium]